MLRLPLFALFAAMAFAQTGADAPSPKPPDAVDQALRARIKAFYDLQLKGKFRQAEAFVAEDAKDHFYNMGKPRYNKCEVVRIEYSESFTQAKALMALEWFVVSPSFPPDVPIKAQPVENWKLENGEWFWFIDPNDEKKPVIMGIGNGKPSGPAAPGVRLMPNPMSGVAPGVIPAQMPETFAVEMLKADKDSLSLKAGAEGPVGFTNTSPGPMKLAVASQPAGIEAKFDNAELKAGGRALLTVRAGKGAQPGKLIVKAEPLGQKITIQIKVE